MPRKGACDCLLWTKAEFDLPYCLLPKGALFELDLGGTRHFVPLANSDGHRMGRYKEYREPKRRGFDDDYIPQD